MNITKTATIASAVALACGSLVAQDPSMVRGIGWRTDAIYTIGTDVNGYTPVGIMDGIGAYPGANGSLKILVNHELSQGNGYPYTLANGTQLTGARISAFDITRTADGRGVVNSAEMAFDTIYDRAGDEVVDPAQVNETGNNIDGLSRFCSSTGVLGGTYGFVEDLYLTGEETGAPFHPHGGSMWILDVDTKRLWAAPGLPRGAWENVTPIETGDPQTVALLMGDDTAQAPLYLYVGTKNGVGDQSFLDRNGLKQGATYVWVADNGDTTPEQFNTEGNQRAGTFQLLSIIDPSMAGMPGYDSAGYKNGATLRAEAQAMGAFQFSRPEDLHVNPADGQQVVFASTGRGSVFPSDNWGTTYIIDVSFRANGPAATIAIVHDADFRAVPDDNVRSPDNLTWANDGYIYIQEDRSTSPSSLFGAVSGADASIWKLNPQNGDVERIGEVNRTVVLPLGATDNEPGELGSWETSGILDVTDLVPSAVGETVLIAVAQAHSIEDGPIGGNANLDEGGQILFLSTDGIDHSLRCTDNGGGLVSIDFDVTNASPNAPYALVLAAANVRSAPNGWFFGINVTLPELGLLIAPLVGFTDGNGDASFSFPLGGFTCPTGLTLDAVVVGLSPIGTPVSAGPAVTHDF